jgi:hypothetical protein
MRRRGMGSMTSLKHRGPFGIDKVGVDKMPSHYGFDSRRLCDVNVMPRMRPDTALWRRRRTFSLSGNAVSLLIASVTIRTCGRGQEVSLVTHDIGNGYM